MPINNNIIKKSTQSLFSLTFNSFKLYIDKLCNEEKFDKITEILLEKVYLYKLDNRYFEELIEHYFNLLDKKEYFEEYVKFYNKLIDLLDVGYIEKYENRIRDRLYFSKKLLIDIDIFSEDYSKYEDIYEQLLLDLDFLSDREYELIRRQLAYFTSKGDIVQPVLHNYLIIYKFIHDIIPEALDKYRNDLSLLMNPIVTKENEYEDVHTIYFDTEEIKYIHSADLMEDDDIDYTDQSRYIELVREVEITVNGVRYYRVDLSNKYIIDSEKEKNKKEEDKIREYFTLGYENENDGIIVPYRVVDNFLKEWHNKLQFINQLLNERNNSIEKFKNSIADRRGDPDYINILNNIIIPQLESKLDNDYRKIYKSIFNNISEEELLKQSIKNIKFKEINDSITINDFPLEIIRFKPRTIRKLIDEGLKKFATINYFNKNSKKIFNELLINLEIREKILREVRENSTNYIYVISALQNHIKTVNAIKQKWHNLELSALKEINTFLLTEPSNDINSTISEDEIIKKVNDLEDCIKFTITENKKRLFDDYASIASVNQGESSSTNKRFKSNDEFDKGKGLMR